MALDTPFDPYAVAREVAAQVELTGWRTKIGEDALTARWKGVFATVIPDSDSIADLAGHVIKHSNGSIPPYVIYTMMLAAWTYGYSKALSQLADEEVLLWTGSEPFEWPKDGTRGN